MSYKFTIDKQFSLCYGHRVYTQILNGEFVEKNDCSAKCRHLHGHEGLVHVFLEAEELTDSMVTDFKHLGWLKNFIDDNMDHKFIIDRNDPMFRKLVVDIYSQSINFEHNNMNTEWFLNNCLVPVHVPGTGYLVGHTINMSHVNKNTPESEILEGYFIVDFVPTSERFAQWLYYIVDAKMSKMCVKTKEIWWNETPKSRSTYKG